MSVEAPLEAPPRGGTFELTTSAAVVPAQMLRRPGSRTGSETAAIAATVTIPVLGLLLCVAGTRTNVLVPVSVRPIPGSLAGVFSFIGFSIPSGAVMAALVVMLGANLFAVWHAERVPLRTLVWAIAAFNVIVLLGPPLFSTDVFSYQAYGRMFAVYHANPYLYGPSVIQPDRLYNYIGSDWIGTPSVYGPLFTFLSGAFGTVSIAFSEFAFKLIAAVASGGTLLLIWRSAPRRGVSPARGIALFGLSPVVVLAGVGGGHNDLLVLLLTTWGVYAMLTRSERAAGALITAGAAVKLTAGVLLPFALLSDVQPGARPRRHAFLIGAGMVAVVIAAASFAVFGSGILHLPSTLQTVQDQGAWQSIPGFLFSAAHVSVTTPVRAVFDVGLVVAVLWLLWQVWQRRMDWIEGAAWATVVVLATAWSLLPWYLSWLMPLVALCSGRRLWRVAMLMSVIAGAMMVAGAYPST